MAKKKMGRPKKHIKQKQFEALCAIQCTQEEICSVLDVCEDTLIDWCKKTYGKTFSKVFQEKRKMGKASLRRNQWKLAEKNATMGIWLGKQYLGQKDENKLELNGGFNAKIDKKVDLSKLDIEELKNLETIVEKASRDKRN